METNGFGVVIKLFIDTKSVIGYIGENFMKHGCLLDFSSNSNSEKHHEKILFYSVINYSYFWTDFCCRKSIAK